MSGAHRKRGPFGRRKPEVRQSNRPLGSLFLPSASAEVMIEAEAVSKQFGSVRALDEVSLSVRRGTVQALLGHNGAGKTTLVNILACALPLSSGRAGIAGFDVTRSPREVRKRIGLTGQFAAVDDKLTGYGNLILIARLLGAGRKGARARADELLDLFELRHVADRKAGTYSGGLRRRLDLAASLVGNPDVLFLDEPTTGLDPSSRLRLWEIVEQLVDDGTTVLLTTQYLEEADRLADAITLLSAGAVVASGTPAQLKARVGQRRVVVTLGSAEEARVALRTLKKSGLEAEIGRERNTVILTAGTQREIAGVIRRLDHMAIDPVELTYGHPSLDDVYLALTEQTGSGPGAEAEPEPVLVRPPRPAEPSASQILNGAIPLPEPAEEPREPDEPSGEASDDPPEDSSEEEPEPTGVKAR